MNRRELLTAAAIPFLLQPSLNAFVPEAFASDAEKESKMSEPKQRIIETNGIHLNIAEQGEGPLVLLCHGFPESW